MSKETVLKRILDEQKSFEFSINLTKEEQEKLNHLSLDEAVAFIKNKKSTALPS